MKDNIFLDFFKWLGKPLDWPLDLYRDLKHWYIMRKVCLDPNVQKIFKENKPEIRYDRIYRLYTVINIPTDMYDSKLESARQTLLIDELRKIEELTLRLGISEILYPEYNIITDVPESFAYLLTHETDKDRLSILKGLQWLIKTFLWTCALLAINALVLNTTGNTIFGWIGSLFA